NSCGVRAVRVLHFSDKPTMGQEYAVPTRETVWNGSAESDIGVYFPTMKKYADVRAQAKCQPEQDKKDSEFKAKFDNMIGAIREDLLARKSKGSCTAIMALLKGVSLSDPALTIILSDGAETCRKTPITIPQPARQAGVYFLIAPSKGD